MFHASEESSVETHFLCMFHASKKSSVETHFLHLTHRQDKNVAQKKRDKNVAR